MPACYRNAERAERRFGDLARAYAAALSTEDEAAAAALAELDALGAEGLAGLDAALERGAAAIPDRQPALRAMFAAIEAPPFAVDPDLMDLGARALKRHGFGYAGATRQSLFWGYSNGAAIKPLAWTERMRTATAAVGRLLETGEWLQAVIRPGALRPHAEGWEATIRVRLLHARVRGGLRRSGRWDEQAWGAPLNAADSAFTLLEFTWMPLRLLRSLGFRYTPREEEGVYALWRLVGHVIGVPAELNAGDPVEADRVLALRELTAGPSDPQSLELVRALLDGNLQPDGTWLQRLAGRAMEAVDRAVAVHNLPPRYPPQLGIRPAAVGRLIPLGMAGVRLVEAIRLRTPGADDWLLRRNDELIRRGEAVLQRRVAMTGRHGHGARPRMTGAAAQARPATSA